MSKRETRKARTAALKRGRDRLHESSPIVRRKVEVLSRDISHNRAHSLKGVRQSKPITRSSKPLSKGLSKNRSYKAK